MDSCSVDTCTRHPVARGWCSLHYQRWQAYGDPLFTLRAPPGASVEFCRRAAESAQDECIIWPFSLTKAGYGLVHVNGRGLTASRYTLSLVTGEDPPDKDCAHAPVICHNRACVNPRHLRWATRAENVADRVLDGTAKRGPK